MKTYNSTHEAERDLRGGVQVTGACGFLTISKVDGKVRRWELPKFSHVPPAFAGYPATKGVN